MTSHATRHSIDLIQSTIVIHEDDALDIPPAENNPKRRIRRCISVPETLWEIRSVMKVRTLDESIHSTYVGSEGGSRGNIRFKSVGIREYARTVGDNPSCSAGPPVSISWEYNPLSEISLDEYERTRPPRRSHFEMVLPKKIRQSMLRSEWGVPQKHIAESVRRNVLVKNQRKATVNNIGKAPRLEEFLESSSRKFKRMITFQPPVSKQVKKLEEMTNEAQRRRSQLALEKFLLLENDNRNHVTPPQDEVGNDTLDTMDVCDASTRTSVTP